MPLIHIYGAPGSGKSTLCQQLITKGYKALETDPLALWTDKDLVAVTAPTNLTKAWMDAHIWYLDPAALGRLDPKETVFLCGNIGNLKDFKDLIGFSIALAVKDRKLLLGRFKARNGYGFGSSRDERDLALEQDLLVDNQFTVLSRENPERVTSEVIRICKIQGYLD